jgi:predicted  nucleic acid-binding Zn-ribbon protein
MRSLILAGTLAVLASGCVSKSEYDRQMEQMSTISAEKDSLLSEVVQTSQFIAEVNTELDRVRSGQAAVATPGEMEAMSPTQQRQALAERVKGLTDRLRESEERLAQSRRRVSQLSANNATMQAQMASFDSTIKSFQRLIDTQKEEIVSLVGQVQMLTSENTALREANVALESQRAALSAEKSALTTEQNTVYWVAGKRDDLRRRGIIELRGGMLGIGRTAVPARTLNAAEFTAVDRTQLSELVLPDSTKAYRIITTNDVAGLASPPTDGRFRGRLVISSPETFWRPSRFLVLIEQ